MNEVSYRAALRAIIKAGNKIMSAVYVKNDGTEREITFRRNVATGVKNNPSEAKNDSRKRVKRGNMMTVVEMDGDTERSWKTINLHTLKVLKVGGESYKVKNENH